jgi:hypothetical protein
MYKLPINPGVYKVTLHGLLYKNNSQIVLMELLNKTLWWPKNGKKVSKSYYQEIVSMEFVRENLSGR